MDEGGTLTHPTPDNGIASMQNAQRTAQQSKQTSKQESKQTSTSATRRKSTEANGFTRCRIPPSPSISFYINPHYMAQEYSAPLKMAKQTRSMRKSGDKKRSQKPWAMKDPLPLCFFIWLVIIQHDNQGKPIGHQKVCHAGA
jgi:hypothetical protein